MIDQTSYRFYHQTVQKVSDVDSEGSLFLVHPLPIHLSPQLFTTTCPFFWSILRVSAQSLCLTSADFSSHVTDVLPSSLGHYFILLVPDRDLSHDLDSPSGQQWKDLPVFVSKYRHTIIQVKDEKGQRSWGGRQVSSLGKI